MPKIKFQNSKQSGKIFRVNTIKKINKINLNKLLSKST